MGQREWLKVRGWGKAMTGEAGCGLGEQGLVEGSPDCGPCNRG